MRDAQSLLEQVLAFAEPAGDKVGQSTVDEKVLQDILGLAERQILYEISSAVVQGDARRCVELVAAVVVEGRDLCRLSRDLLDWHGRIERHLRRSAVPAVILQASFYMTNLLMSAEQIRGLGKRSIAGPSRPGSRRFTKPSGGSIA